jgi:hypothetical protein
MEDGRMTKAPMKDVYDFIVSRPGMLPITLAQELKAEFHITRIVEALDIIKATRGSIADARGTSPRV